MCSCVVLRFGVVLPLFFVVLFCIARFGKVFTRLWSVLGHFCVPTHSRQKTGGAHDCLPSERALPDSRWRSAATAVNWGIAIDRRQRAPADSSPQVPPVVTVLGPPGAAREPAHGPYTTGGVLDFGIGPRPCVGVLEYCPELLML